MSMGRRLSCRCRPENPKDGEAANCNGGFHDGAPPPCNDCCARRFAQAGGTDSGLISTEVNGFVLWIASFAFSLCYLLWAVVPHEYAHQFSITYLLNTYWALAVPVLVLIGLATIVLMYDAINLLSVRPLESFSLVSDEQAPPPCADRLAELRATAAFVSTASGSCPWQQPLRPPQGVPFSQFQDLPLSLTNRIMFPLPADTANTTSPGIEDGIPRGKNQIRVADAARPLARMIKLHVGGNQERWLGGERSSASSRACEGAGEDE